MQPAADLILTPINIPKVWENATCARYTLKENNKNRHTLWLSDLAYYNVPRKLDSRIR